MSVRTKFLTALFLAICISAEAADKPNLLVIFGDDIGTGNVSAYSSGAMGYETPRDRS